MDLQFRCKPCAGDAHQQNPGGRGKGVFPSIIDEVDKVFHKHAAMLLAVLSIQMFIRLVAEPCSRPKCITLVASDASLIEVCWVLKVRVDLIHVPKLSAVGKIMASAKDDHHQEPECLFK